MGYDPNDKARMEEMKKSAGPAYGGSFVASLLSAFTLALIPTDYGQKTSTPG